MKQDSDLEESCKQRMDESKADTESDWDPIDDAIEGSGGKHIDLIYRLLLIQVQDNVKASNMDSTNTIDFMMDTRNLDKFMEA